MVLFVHERSGDGRRVVRRHQISGIGAVATLFDIERVEVLRGLFFETEPPDFATRLYTRLGDPRQLGLSFEWRF